MLNKNTTRMLQSSSISLGKGGNSFKTKMAQDFDNKSLFRDPAVTC